MALEDISDYAMAALLLAGIGAVTLERGCTPEQAAPAVQQVQHDLRDAADTALNTNPEDEQSSQ
jgi:hypothetical protein